MIGFAIGTGCLLGIGALLHGHFHRGTWACRSHHSRFHPWHHDRRRPWLYVLSEELDLTPGQEKAFRSAEREFADSVHPLRTELHRSRDDLARALRAELFDPAIPAGAFARHDAALGTLRGAVVRLLESVHEVLEPKQRARLADWIESHHGPACGHPYRTAGL